MRSSILRPSIFGWASPRTASRMPLAAALVLFALRAAAQVPVADWPVTEGAPGGGRFSPLTEITRENVAQLEVAWTYRHGDFWEGSFPLEVNRGSAFESTPLVVDGRLLFTTPRNRVIALDPETGRELWTFDPKLAGGRTYANMWINRGVAYWRDDAAESAGCARRVFLATLDARLIALDAESGTPCPDFGENGHVDLRVGIEPLYDDWEYNVTSPGTVVGDVIVVGSSIADTLRPDAPPGDVRAYDVRTGALRDLPHDPASRRAGLRDLGDRDEAVGRGERLVHDHRGSRARTRVPADEHAEPRLLWRRPARREPVLGLGRGARREDWGTPLALPDRAPRSLRLRPRGASGARDPRT